MIAKVRINGRVNTKEHPLEYGRSREVSGGGSDRLVVHGRVRDRPQRAAGRRIIRFPSLNPAHLSRPVQSIRSLGVDQRPRVALPGSSSIEEVDVADPQRILLVGDLHMNTLAALQVIDHAQTKTNPPRS